MARGSTDLCRLPPGGQSGHQQEANGRKKLREQKKTKWPLLTFFGKHKLLVLFVADGILVVLLPSDHHWNRSGKNNTTLVIILTNINCWSCLLQMVYLLFFSHPTTTESEEEEKKKKQQLYASKVNKGLTTNFALWHYSLHFCLRSLLVLFSPCCVPASLLNLVSIQRPKLYGYIHVMYKL